MLWNKSSRSAGLRAYAVNLQEGKVKNTPWGSSFSAPPEILHGECILLAQQLARPPGCPPRPPFFRMLGQEVGCVCRVRP